MSTHRRAAVALSRPAPRRAAATLGTALLGLLMLVWSAPGASAHNGLISTDPADGSTVATAPEQITLVFNEPGQALGSEIVVTAPDGTVVSDGAVQLVDASVTQALTGDLPAGAYSVTWRVTSADGHPIDGSFTFTAEAATTVGADPGASAETEMTTQAEDPAATEEPSDEGTLIATAPADDAAAEDEDAGLAAGAIVALVVGVLALAAVVTFVVVERRKTKATQTK